MTPGTLLLAQNTSKNSQDMAIVARLKFTNLGFYLGVLGVLLGFFGGIRGLLGVWWEFHWGLCGAYPEPSFLGFS